MFFFFVFWILSYKFFFQNLRKYCKMSSRKCFEAKLYFFLNLSTLTWIKFFLLNKTYRKLFKKGYRNILIYKCQWVNIFEKITSTIFLFFLFMLLYFMLLKSRTFYTVSSHELWNNNFFTKSLKLLLLYF